MKKLMLTVILCAALPAGSILAEEPAKNPAAAGFEKRFLEMMSHHHQGGADMADLCQTKATHAELKSFCEKVASAQKEERQQMESWRRDWYQGQGGMPKAEMDKMMAEHKRHMATLNAASGEKFDTSFLEMMSTHHKEGIAEAGSCTTKAEHRELKDLCAKMKSDQQKEVSEMQGWLHSWTGHK